MKEHKYSFPFPEFNYIHFVYLIPVLALNTFNESIFSHELMIQLEKVMDNKAYITKFLHTFESDVRIPNLDELPEWEITDFYGENVHYRPPARPVESV